MTVRLLLTVLLLLSARVAYADPVPLFDRKFDPPLLHVSGINSDGEMLAVQAGVDGRTPARVISIDRRGAVEVIDGLDREEVYVPSERLWIASGADRPGEGEETPTGGAMLPVESVRVFLSGGGESYTVVYLTAGAFYELQHKDCKGGLLFIAAPRDAYGFKTCLVPYDGSRLLVLDQSRLSGSGKAIGQRFYIYDKKGALIADADLGAGLDDWLNLEGGIIAGDGSYIMAEKGVGENPSVVMLDGEGRLKWEKSFFASHRLLEDYGGLVRVKGGNKSFISLVDMTGSLLMLERAAYGFDFWVSGGRESAFLIVFKPFGVEKTKVPASVKELFPKAKLILVDLEKLLPEGVARPGIEIAPGGKRFIHYSVEILGTGQRKTHFALYDSDMKRLWRDAFFGEASPKFAGSGNGFVVRFGHPASRLIYYEDRQGSLQ